MSWERRGRKCNHHQPAAQIRRYREGAARQPTFPPSRRLPSPPSLRPPEQRPSEQASASRFSALDSLESRKPCLISVGRLDFGKPVRRRHSTRDLPVSSPLQMFSTVPRSSIPTLSAALPSPAASSRCSQDTQSSCEGLRAVLPRGLCTPPDDDKMGTAFEVPHLVSCENYHVYHPSACASAVPPSDRRRQALSERPPPNASNANHTFNTSSSCSVPLPDHPQQPRLPQGPGPSAPPAAAFPATARSTAGREYAHAQPARPSASTSTSAAPAVVEQPGADAGLTLHSMKIPARISPKGGNLADFMAEVAALFWFESIKTLDRVGKAQTITPGKLIQPLAPAAVACQHFKKWVSSVLSTTQVTQNVVALALLYVYRLKMANPTVRGRPGSEYRLLTVALILGNKFLDDNTYTNKTWADVTGISVAEIHVMEVEFLSNMRYSLLVSAEEWERWLDKLAKFWSYLELAKRASSPSPPPLLIPSPTCASFVSPLQSPTQQLQLAPSVPPPTGHPLNSQSPGLASLPNGNGTHTWPSSCSGSSPVSPLALKPEPLAFRKRSFPDHDVAEPPAKRVGRVPAGQVKLASHHVPSQASQHPQAAVHSHAQRRQQHVANAPVVQSHPAPAVVAEQGRLPVPNLTLNTAQAAAAVTVSQQSQAYGPVAYAPAQVSPLSLPPLASGVRAMSTVFPTSTYPASQSSPATCGTVTPTTTYPAMGYSTPTKRRSPPNGLMAAGVPAFPGSSPLIDSLSHMTTPMVNGGTTSGLHTPVTRSPLVYLQQRNSPYKPVRHVNTLLYPPSSAFLRQYSAREVVLPNQMHYRPLGKRNEYRTGIVPEFTMTSANLPSTTAAVPSMYQPAQQAVPAVGQPSAHYPPRPAAVPAPYQGQY